MHHLGGLVGRPQPGHDEARVRAQAALGIRVGEAGEPALGRGDGRQVDERCDAPVPLGEQVLGGEPAAAVVVDGHRVDVDAAGWAVDEDGGGAGPQLADEVVLALARRHDHQPVDPAGDQVVDELLLAVGALVEAGREHRRAVAARGVLEGAKQAGGERVRQVLHQGADQPGAGTGAAQVAGGQVGAVVEPLDGGGDPLAHVGGDAGLVVDHPRHRLQADPGERRDVTHGGAVALT